jgi:uncharacterized protein YgiM (DUF1202 family)
MHVLLRRLPLGLACLACLSLLLQVGYGAETVYVQAKNAQLRSGKTSLSPTVATVQFGEALEKLRQEGEWLEVRTASGSTGWIFVNKTTPTKPAGGESSLARLGQAMRRTEAAPVTAATGARGLDKVSEEYASRTGISKQYQDEVDRMTAYKLTDQEVEAFLREGRLGEYAQ